jgi:site-specific recombinase XerD
MASGARLTKPAGESFLRNAQHLAVIRQLFAYLTTAGILEVDPAASVRGPGYVVKRGKTRVLSSEEARKLLDSIESNTLIGQRDRALIGTMVYSFARVGAAISMKVGDYFQHLKRWWLRLHEAASATKCPAIRVSRNTLMIGSVRRDHSRQEGAALSQHGQG